jgi:NTE family protein
LEEEKKDIRFHDNTDYDIKLAQNISDYYDFVEKMTNLANNAIKEASKNKENNIESLKNEFQIIVNTEQRTPTRDDKPRYFYNLIDKRFDIDDILKIQRKDDKHTISDKIFDFSQESVSGLINDGIYDTLYKIYQENDREFFKKWFNRYIEEIEKQNIKEILKPILQFKEKERL